VTVLRLEVPCCGGIVHAAVEAARASGKPLAVKAITIAINGDVLDTEVFEPVGGRAAAKTSAGARA
jgi:hypothetical protein